MSNIWIEDGWEGDDDRFVDSISGTSLELESVVSIFSCVVDIHGECIRGSWSDGGSHSVSWGEFLSGVEHRSGIFDDQLTLPGGSEVESSWVSLVRDSDTLDDVKFDLCKSVYIFHECHLPFGARCGCECSV